MAVTPKTLIELLREQPFGPFQVTMSSGRSFVVRHPELMVVQRADAWIGIVEEPAPAAAAPTDVGYPMGDYGVLVDLLHVVSVQPLPRSEAG